MTTQADLVKCACGEYDFPITGWLRLYAEGDAHHSEKVCVKDCPNCLDGIVTRAFAEPHDQPCPTCMGSGAIVLGGSLHEPNEEGNQVPVHRTVVEAG